MNKLISGVLIASTTAFLAGCEWGGGGGGWDSRYNFVNFSGSYQGSPLVSAYSATGGGGGSTASGETFVNYNESTTRNIQSLTVISGSVAHPTILAGSFSITGSGVLSGFSAHDNGSGGIVGDSFVLGGQSIAVSGFIVYGTGQWSINFSPASPIDTSTTLAISYSQVVPPGSGGAGSGTPGSTKVTILAFNVQQSGNQLKIIDNNGSVYDGSFGDIRTTGGTSQDTANPTFANGDEIIGQYSASGTDAAGIKVKMVGTFQATVAGVSSTTGGGTSGGGTTTTSLTLGNRTMLGTWVEDGGATGNINGHAASVTVSTTSTSSSTNTVH